MSRLLFTLNVVLVYGAFIIAPHTPVMAIVAAILGWFFGVLGGVEEQLDQ